MSNEALTEAIAKTIFDYGAKNDYMEPDEFGIVHASTRSIAAAIMLCPELIAALAPPAPHIVDTVEGLEAMPAGSALLDSRGGVILIEDPTVHLSESARAVIRDLAPFTVLHVGGAE